MRVRVHRTSIVISLVAGLTTVVGCTASAPSKPESAEPKAVYTDTPIPTVPPATPLPSPAPGATAPEPPELKAAPAESAKATARPGQPIGPIVTYFGAARADGMVAPPASVDKGIPTFRSGAGGGFIMVVEAKPGPSGADVARRIFNHQPDDATQRPDIEIISNKPLGDGSKEVCDRRPPNIGGIPAAASFAETQAISDAINDLTCRFETFLESESSCTLDKLGNFSFASKDTTVQFCAMVARSFAFPIGTTDVQVRVRDVSGNYGPVAKMRIVRPKTPPTPAKPAKPAKVEQKKTEEPK